MTCSDIFLVGILILVFIKYYLNRLHQKSKVGASSFNSSPTSSQTKTLWDIPGPTALPLIGTKWIFFFRYKIKKLHEAYIDFNKKFGDIALEVAPGQIPIVHLFNRNDIETVLRYPSKYPFRPPTEIIAYYRKIRPDRYASAGLPHEQGEQWFHLRSNLTQHMTSPRVLQQFLPTLNEICNDFIALLRYKREDHTNIVHNFQDLTNLLGLEAVCALMLGRRMGFLSIDDNQPEKFKLLAVAVKQLFIAQRDSFYGLGLWKYVPTKMYRQFVESEETIYNIVSDIIDNTTPNDSNAQDDDLKTVFLDILNNKNLDIRDKKSAIIDFIAAGIETLANTLIFNMYYLSKNQSCQLRILEEFNSSTDMICQENLSKATYTKACIQEVYRLQPTAFCLARLLEEDTKLSNYHINAGTVVLCHTMIASRKNENFREAQKFMPERWIQNNNFHVRNEPGSALVIPFGTGKRTCPGKRFIGLELLVLIAKLLTNFEIEFQDEIEIDCEFLLAARSPVNIILKDISIR